MNIFKNITVGGVPKEILIQRLIESGVQFNVLKRCQDTSGSACANKFFLIPFHKL
jgi:hypothetical protein